jgi:hypothetical protein
MCLRCFLLCEAVLLGQSPKKKKSRAFSHAQLFNNY